MIEILNILSIILILLGSICNAIAGFGIFYFPDIYSRMHATGVTDTLGSGLILVGLMFQTGWDSALGKLILILLFTLITSPTISYVLANTAMRNEEETIAGPSNEGESTDDSSTDGQQK